MMLMILPRPGQVRPGQTLRRRRAFDQRGPIEQGDPSITGYMISRKSSDWKTQIHMLLPHDSKYY